MYGIYLKQDPTVGNSRVVYNPKDEKRTGRRKQNEQEQCRQAFMDPLCATRCWWNSLLARWRFHVGPWCHITTPSLHVCICQWIFFTARRDASAVFAVVMCLSVRPSVRHKPVFDRNDWTNRIGFRHGGFFPLVLHCVMRKFGYLHE